MKLSLAALILGFSSLPAIAGTVLYSDLGTGASMYSTGVGYYVSGAASSNSGGAVGIASLFTVAGSGSEAVGEIDFGAYNISGLDTFTASIWTDSSGAPGSLVTGAFWDLDTTISSGTCCSLISVTGISGVTLTGGQSYFMELQPVDYSDTSWNGWFLNNQSVNNDLQYTINGVLWTDLGNATAPAFDVLSGGTVAAPEPATLLLFGSGLATILVLRSRKRAAK